MTEFVVRPFQQEDRQSVLRIGADTAFFGAPIEAYLEDRNVFLDIFYVYYTDVEPQYAWVACADDIVVGFLTGSVDTRARTLKFLRTTLPRFLGKLVRGTYRFGRLTRAYVAGLLGSGFYGEEPHVDLSLYPAHLHINVDSAWRGHGLGQRLMEAYLGQLRSLGVRGVHLETTSLNEVACRLYEKMGFRLLDAHPTRFWSKWFGHAVDYRAYGLKLSDGSARISLTTSRTQ